MVKTKRDKVSGDMRARLLVNRDGKLTTEQWKSIVTEPLVTLLVLMIPGAVVLGPRLAYFFVGGYWLVSVIVAIAVVAVLLARAMRYARAPVQVGRFYAGEHTPAGWMFWKPEVLYTEADKPVKFSKRLAPRASLTLGEPYLVYYLKDAENYVLLSVAPADHEDAARWQPTSLFQARASRRSKG
jgi:hypothetical protein